MSAILSVKNIHKRFPGVYALKGVNLDVFTSEVHALVGENGAGKSTLMNIIAGVFKPDEGKIFFDGKERVWNSTADALRSGISTIFQELSVMPNLTVAENIFLGMEPLKGPLVRFGEMYAASKKLLEDFGLDVKPDERLGNYSIAIQQMVEIIRAIKREAKVIIMDEPTSSLTEKEVEKTFEVMRHLRSEGIAIIFISHKLEEVFEIADRVSVLRDGELVGTARAEELNEDTVAEMMVGRKIESYYVKELSEIGQEVLRVEGFSGDGFDDVSFSLRKGEILGFYGLVGAGRTELMETIFGFRRKRAGRLFVKGEEVDIRHPLDAIRRGIGMVPEDRRISGLVLIMTVRENVTLPNLDSIKKGWFIRRREEMELANWAISSFDIKTPSAEKQVMYLSGGNQQKVVLAKWLALKPDVLILDEPTRGIDVGTKAEIYRLMSELAKSGIAIIMVSSELPEILQMSDRVVVMSAGKVAGIVPKEEIKQERLIKMAIGMKDK